MRNPDIGGIWHACRTDGGAGDRRSHRPGAQSAADGSVLLRRRRFRRQHLGRPGGGVRSGDHWNRVRQDDLEGDGDRHNRHARRYDNHRHGGGKADRSPRQRDDDGARRADHACDRASARPDGRRRIHDHGHDPDAADIERGDRRCAEPLRARGGSGRCRLFDADGRLRGDVVS
ncbi:hypothetical protein SDC9_131824 [bioreactor metagenome]|uniref:Uncharacterized protein n=1 Tax=bioreactor metagenome TaxID=1076179 RepID=A0A645D6R0_9ZZZZ